MTICGRAHVKALGLRQFVLHSERVGSGRSTETSVPRRRWPHTWGHRPKAKPLQQLSPVRVIISLMRQYRNGAEHALVPLSQILQQPLPRAVTMIRLLTWAHLKMLRLHNAVASTARHTAAKDAAESLISTSATSPLLI